MTTQPEDHNPFPEPQTIPTGWDLSALLPAPTVDPAAESDDSAES
jgi:hypothetical protein